MKKILVMFLCLILVTSVVSCDKKNDDTKPEKAQSTTQSTTQDTTQEASTEDKLPYVFISEQERLSWRDKIVTVISSNDFYDDYEVLGHNFLGMALMDLNFDNTPEVIAAYAGGSMGNVCIVAYDLESGAEQCVLGDTPHYQDWNNVYFCVHKNNDGNYLIVNEGSLRDGLEWYMITSSLNDKFELDALFEEVIVDGADNRYYCDGNEVEKAEFEQQKNQFKNDYKEIPETQVKIIYWEDIDTTTESGAISAMADKLVNSEQQFIRFDTTLSTGDKTEEEILADCEKAYLDFLKDKKESYRLFSLVFIDDDDIPELYLMGACEAQGDMVCSFKNGTVIPQQLRRTGGGKYIERSGDMINQNGNMGRCYTNVYRLNENGFTETFNALSSESVEYIDGKGGEYRFIHEYFIDDTPVSEADYNDALSSAFDLSKAVELDENAVSYNAIIEQLHGDNSVG